MLRRGIESRPTGLRRGIGGGLPAGSRFHDGEAREALVADEEGRWVEPPW